MTQGVRARVIELAKDRPFQAAMLVGAVLATAAAAAPMGAKAPPRVQLTSTPIERAVEVLSPPEPLRIVWEGADVDGDGKSDFANPTGQAPRTHDAYGSGAFGASRDGGARRHEGVDFAAEAGQTVVAPISGYVTKIGYAYAGTNLRFVEITNPALRFEARAFYVKPSVKVGDTVAVGQPIGRVHSLQSMYPGGMTDHVHLELVDRRGRRFDANEVLTAEVVGGARG